MGYSCSIPPLKKYPPLIISCVFTVALIGLQFYAQSSTLSWPRPAHVTRVHGNTTPRPVHVTHIHGNTTPRPVHVTRIHGNTTPRPVHVTPIHDNITASLADSKYPNTHVAIENCSLAFLKFFFVKYGTPPFNGTWKLTEPAMFNFANCRFPLGARPQAELLRRLLNEKNISRIATVGDSNAYHTSKAVQSLLRCRIIAQEITTPLPDIAYFKQVASREPWLPYLKVSEKNCSGCNGFVSTCSGDVRVTYFAMTSLMDQSITVSGSHDNASFTQEFLFKLWLPLVNPDVLLFFPPANHVKWLPSKTINDQIQIVRDLIEKYVPNHVKTIFMPGFTESEEARRHNEEFYNKRTVEGLLGTEKVELINKMWLATNSDELKDATKNIFAFFDLMEISRERKGWSTDGVHMKPQWYKAVASMVVQTLCC